MSPSSEFKESSGGGGGREVRTLNQHFRLVLSVWHHEELVQVAGTCDMCAWFQQPESGPCLILLLPWRAQSRQRVDRLLRDGL